LAPTEGSVNRSKRNAYANSSVVRFL